MKKLLFTFLVAIATFNSIAQISHLYDFTGAQNVYNPSGDLYTDGTYFYGMNPTYGLTNNYGNIFKVKKDGTGYTVLHNFDSINGYKPSSECRLISDGTYLYGMTVKGGTLNKGVIFKIKPDGTGFTKINDFSGTNGGSNPYGSLYYDGTFLYGMTSTGGTYSTGYGIVFKIMPDGTGFTNLLNFNGSNGQTPYGGLISDGTYLYGMTNKGGYYNEGCIFQIKPDGTGYSTINSFYHSWSGTYPNGDLYYDGTYLYGMTVAGGTYYGTIFKILPNGSGYTTLHTFDNTNGNNPYGSLVSDGTFLYGTTYSGGTNSNQQGIIFKIRTDGTSFQNLFNFDGINGKNPSCTLVYDGTNLFGTANVLFKIMPDGTGYTRVLDLNFLDGSYPKCTLISNGNYLYGTTFDGGYGEGVIYKIKPDGTGYSIFHRFLNNEGIIPRTLFSDGTYLYGATDQGGANNSGTIYKIKLDGTGFQKLYDFAVSESTNGSNNFLISDGTYLYGMRRSVVFKIKPDGTGYTKLYTFGAYPDGSTAYGSLLLFGNYLYGMTSAGGDNLGGTIFRIKPDGTSYTKLYNFQSGSLPKGTLITDGIYFYGMRAFNGASTTNGTVFRINPDGTGFTDLYNFNGIDGSLPLGNLYSDGANFYGTASSDGNNSKGLVFKFPSPHPVCIANYVTTYDSITNNFTLTVDNTTASTAISYLWDFGDGSTSTLASPSHTYTVDTTYDVCMTITTSTGFTCTYCHTIGKDWQGNIYRNAGFTINVNNPNSSVGISQVSNSNSQISIYPNPFTSQTTISFSEAQKNAIVKVIDVLGKEIKTINFTGKELTIEKGEMQSGIYFVQITSENKTVTNRKIVLQ